MERIEQPETEKETDITVMHCGECGYPEWLITERGKVICCECGAEAYNITVYVTNGDVH